MKTQLMTHGRKWCLYSALLTVMGYSALTLTSEPAYAATCTAYFCNDPSQARYYCEGFCAGAYNSHMSFLQCPYPDSSHWDCGCTDGHMFAGLNCQ